MGDMMVLCEYGVLKISVGGDLSVVELGAVKGWRLNDKNTVTHGDTLRGRSLYLYNGTGGRSRRFVKRKPILVVL